MRTSCLVNNFNYCAYLGEAIDSVLAQTVRMDEIIVVDDGSTDESVAFLRDRYANESRVQVVAKPNGGQLSAIHTGLKHSTGELLLFLDADDRYRKNYLQSLLETYDRHPVDFAISGVAYFGKELRRQRPVKVRRPRNLGYSTLATMLLPGCVGGPTSSLSMRRDVAEKFLPFPFEEDWRIRADDLLGMGSSLVGARKFHLGAPCVEYRIHSTNRFHGQTADANAKFQHSLAVHRLIEWYARQMALNPERAGSLLHREFQTIERPLVRDWLRYLAMSWRCRLPLAVRARHLCRTTQHFVRQTLMRSRSDVPQWCGETSVGVESSAKRFPQGQRAA